MLDASRWPPRPAPARRHPAAPRPTALAFCARIERRRSRRRTADTAMISSNTSQINHALRWSFTSAGRIVVIESPIRFLMPRRAHVHLADYYRREHEPVHLRALSQNFHRTVEQVRCGEPSVRFRERTRPRNDSERAA